MDAASLVPPRQLQLLLLIENGREQLGAAPSYDELAEAMKISKAGIQDQLKKMLARGLIIKTYGVCRSLRLTADGRAHLTSNRE